jgi:hypothetical protein
MNTVGNTLQQSSFIRTPLPIFQPTLQNNQFKEQFSSPKSFHPQYQQPQFSGRKPLWNRLFGWTESKKYSEIKSSPEAQIPTEAQIPPEAQTSSTIIRTDIFKRFSDAEQLEAMITTALQNPNGVTLGHQYTEQVLDAIDTLRRRAHSDLNLLKRFQRKEKALKHLPNLSNLNKIAERIWREIEED